METLEIAPSEKTKVDQGEASIRMTMIFSRSDIFQQIPSIGCNIYHTCIIMHFIKCNHYFNESI